MDANKQTDQQNTTPSQELDGENASSVADAGGGNTPQEKKSFIKDLWGRFNLYLLLFILLLVVAIAATVVLTIKGKSANNGPSNVNEQNLSANALKQLASSGTTVGNPNQVLNVESSAVFDGTVLVRKNLEVAGSLQLSSNFSLPSINVTGQGTFGQVQAQSLTISGAASIQGLLSAKNGIDVSGDGSFAGTVTATKLVTNSLQLNGNLVFTDHVTAGGLIPRLSQGNALGSGGTASVSGSDTAGSIAVNTGGNPSAGCFATLTFTQAFSATPHVVVTPINAGAGGLSFYVVRSTTTMSVCTTTPPPSGQSFGFDYVIFD